MVKPATASAVMQLQEQGLLDIDDPVKNHLPFFNVKYPSANSKIITIRHLLTHRSGLHTNVPEVIGWIHFDGDPEWNQTELIKKVLPDYAERRRNPRRSRIPTYPPTQPRRAEAP